MRLSVRHVGRDENFVPPYGIVVVLVLVVLLGWDFQDERENDVDRDENFVLVLGTD